ncbi:glycosyltransferase family 2 protein [Streptomyces sp. SP18CS02]|uniref:glycosyltransferase family 2 protein n=1 Tax=Streptomyces sp. SP18CS02 TaxID=3002531 RepID=UPI002E75C469|nr:glycosyltransferase family 2 protein [Streptomyces sp. SP18CS02]MEE1752217.1 glycosyltransferase family 2 protein [Streptomyces sp. SP18CS02]
MSTDPDVTVTVIVHDDAARLPRAVASVRAQTHRNIEIVISDDHSTDATPQVAAALAAKDHRIRLLRLEENSGGCGAPRNRAMEIARAPYLMFLDSDDELPPKAVELLLAAHREEPVDFVMGAVRRVRAGTGATSTWMAPLYGRRRTVHGIEAEPRLLFEPLATNKMYRKDFLDRHALRFPEGIHYEDQLFSARAYTLAHAFTVIPEPVYRWYVDPHAAPEKATISNQRHLIGNVRDRVAISRMIDQFLAGHGCSAAVREEKDFKFLSHDLRMYTGDLPYREIPWIARFADETVPYLDELSPAAFERLGHAERVVVGLLREGRYAEVRLAARGLGHGVGPREMTTDARGRAYWGGALPVGDAARRDLDLTALDLTRCPFAAAAFRHEITRVEQGPGAAVDLTVRTYDPALRLPLAPQAAHLHISPAGRRMTTGLRMDPVARGVYEGTVRLDLAAAPLPAHGFLGVRHPVLEIGDGQSGNTGVMLAPLDFTPFVLAGPGRHRITVEPEGHGAGRLQLRWRPQGVVGMLLGQVVQRGPLRRAARALARR